MSVDGGNSVLKTLVDSLANTLTKLSVRQESIEKDIAKIEQAVDHIPEINRVLSDIKVDQKLLKEAIDKISDAIQKVNEISKVHYSELKTAIEPVSKLSELLRKPLAIVVTIAVVLGAAIGLYKLAQDTGKFFSKNPPAAQTNQVTTIP